MILGPAASCLQADLTSGTIHYNNTPSCVMFLNWQKRILCGCVCWPGKGFWFCGQQHLDYKLRTLKGLSTWFYSHCSGRIQSVRSEGVLSDPLPMSKGVPQGSILGPSLLKVYINNFAHAASSSHTHVCTDDTILPPWTPPLLSCNTASVVFNMASPTFIFS